ncbi:MAG: 23S rRNA (guanosine(2251)-2'-O)-methyltransferase RlmB [Tissierellia bacterium]|nr:23S rRNA (guanosine(2251)-2'-O)-methyltransferase RlmB [Bacillota bacterium]NLL22511.1 23S rRNA (guanosine(2251)-2'-O)-methyltransferase RlmB [Tissierellia bacterium]
MSREFLTGKNSLKEALEAQLGIERVIFQRDMERKRISELIDLLEERGIPFDWADKQRLNAVSPKHQGVIAYLSAFPYADLTDLIEQNRFLIMCDGITDPHNLGAIIRSAYSFGAGGIIIPKRRSAGVDAVVFRASAGAAAHLPVARVPNLSAAIRTLKDEGYWIYGAHAHESSGEDTAYDKKALLIIGSEDRGLSKEVQKQCDFFVRIPTERFESLNASVAAAILMYSYYMQHK